MNPEYVRERITQLRLQKGVSEYKMSYDLGHSRSYINNISSGKTLHSMSEFFSICDYFGITPIEFFDSNMTDPKLMQNTIQGLEVLNSDDLLLVQKLVERLKNR